MPAAFHLSWKPIRSLWPLWTTMREVQFSVQWSPQHFKFPVCSLKIAKWCADPFHSLAGAVAFQSRLLQRWGQSSPDPSRQGSPGAICSIINNAGQIERKGMRHGKCDISVLRPRWTNLAVSDRNRISVRNQSSLINTSFIDLAGCEKQPAPASHWWQKCAFFHFRGFSSWLNTERSSLAVKGLDFHFREFRAGLLWIGFISQLGVSNGK